jgi:hypothetical protein
MRAASILLWNAVAWSVLLSVSAPPMIVGVGLLVLAAVFGKKAPFWIGLPLLLLGLAVFTSV